MFGLNDKDSLPSRIGDELELVVSKIRGWALGNHDEAGNHTDIIATSMTVTNGIKEHGRTVTQGEWTEIELAAADVTSDSGTFAFTLTNKVLRYMKVGKTIFLQFDIFNNGVITGTPEFLFIRLPASLEMARLNESFAFDDRIYGTTAMSSQGTIEAYVGQKAAGGAYTTYLVLELAPSGLFAADAAFSARGQLFYEARNF